MVHNFKIYDADNFFILFFKHFVNARGLKTLTNFNEDNMKLNVNNKSDNFIWQSMVHLYNQAD